MLFLIFWTIFVGGFGLIFLFIGDAHHSPPIFYPLFINLIGWGPMALTILKFQKGRRKKQDLENEWRTYMLAEAGIPAGTGFDHYEASTGIALNREAKTLTVLQKRDCKTYTYDQLRAKGPYREQADARRRPDEQEDTSRLILNISFGSSPIVFLHVSDSATRDKWVKILQQEIYDN